VRAGERLTGAELHLAGVLADTSLSPQQVALQFGVSTWAVKRLQARVYGKLGVHSRAGLRTVLLECEFAAVGS
jgi:DNA-binding CsgD family transcriptional regulator